MTERQLTVCASALWANGGTREEIAHALGVSADRAQELMDRGAGEQARGTIGFMASPKKGRMAPPDDGGDG